MDWNSIISDVISGAILLGIGGVGGWVVGIAKGKKKSSLAIERKHDIYQPLLDELSKYATFDWGILTEINTPKLSEVTNNHYKYGLRDELLRKCVYVNNLIQVYSQINTIRIAHKIIVQIFVEAYTEIYGSIIDGISYHSDRDGNEWETEEVVEPVKLIEQLDFSKQIRDLLFNEGVYSDEIYVDYENALYEPIYRQLKDIYASVLYSRINGEQHKLPSRRIELNMLPEEYMAYHYDFFEKYNKDEDILKKIKVREDIIYSSQSIVQYLKEIIEEIVTIYEVEQI